MKQITINQLLAKLIMQKKKKQCNCFHLINTIYKWKYLKHKKPFYHRLLKHEIGMIFVYFQHYADYDYDTQPVYKPVVKHHHHHEEEQNLHKIPGVPGYDYPVYHEVPHTSFTCSNGIEKLG